MSASTSCLGCPLNTFSPARSFNITFCDCNEGYTGPDGTACVSCDQTNTYKPTRGSGNCSTCTKDLCDVGFFRPMCNITTDGICQRCSNAPDFAVYTGPGLPYFQENCNWTCDSVGGYVESSKNGTFCSVRGRERVCFSHETTCVKCDDNCSTGYVSKDCRCQSCASGGAWPPVHADYEAPSSVDDRHPCGWQCKSGLSSTRCHGPGNGLCRLPCPAGTHGDANDKCQACPAGKSSSSLNFSTTAEDCSSCVPGKYKPELGVMACETRESVSIDECVLLGTCPDKCPSACAPLDGTLSVCCRAFIDTAQDTCQSFSCLPCPNDTFAAFFGAAKCDKCPPDSISALGSTNRTDCKCSPGFEGPDGGSCSKCAVGTFKKAAGADAGSCVRCKAGTYAPGDASTACLLCDSGTTSVAGSASCTAEQVLVQVILDLAFNASYFQQIQSQYAENIADVAGVSSLGIQVSNILNSSFTDSNRRLLASTVQGIVVVWDILSPRFHLPALKASIKTALTTRLSEIGPAPRLQSLLESCGTGREPVGIACAQCPVGEYKSKADNSSCVACDNGTTTAAAGSTSESECVCVAGYFMNASTSVCTPCPPGTFKPLGSEPCIPCPKGMYSPGTSAARPSAVCLFCPVDSYRSPVGSSAKEDCCPEGCVCDAGYNELGDDSARPFECVACASGYFKEAGGTGPCLLCGKGRFTNVTSGATSCLICPTDTYNDLSDGTSCKECPPFTSTVADGGSSIMDCKCEFSPTLRCAGCPAGQYGIVDADRQVLTMIQGRCQNVNPCVPIDNAIYRIDAIDMRNPLPGNIAVTIVTYVGGVRGLAYLNTSTARLIPVTGHGAGQDGYSGYVDGPGEIAEFREGINDLAASPDGSMVLVADFYNHVIRKVDLDSKNVTTFAGCCSFSSPDASSNNIGSRDGNRSFAQFSRPRGVTFNSDGTCVYISDGVGLRVINMETDQVSTLFRHGHAGWAQCGGPRQLTITPDDTTLVFLTTHVCTLDLDTNEVSVVAGGGSREAYCDNGRYGPSFCPGKCSFEACSDDGIGGQVRFRIQNEQGGIAMHPDGLIAFVADYGNARVRSVNIKTGQVSTVTARAAFRYPFPIAVTPEGAVLVSDQSRRWVDGSV